MKKLFSIITVLLMSFSALAQSDNLLEYNIQVKESDSGYAIIVGGGDYISSDYWKTRIDIGVKETLDEAVNRLQQAHFNIKATTTVNGKQVVTMSAKFDPSTTEKYFNEMLKIADELEKMFNESINIEYNGREQ